MTAKVKTLIYLLGVILIGVCLFLLYPPAGASFVGALLPGVFFYIKGAKNWGWYWLGE